MDEACRSPGRRRGRATARASSEVGQELVDERVGLGEDPLTTDRERRVFRLDAPAGLARGGDHLPDERGRRRSARRAPAARATRSVQPTRGRRPGRSPVAPASTPPERPIASGWISPYASARIAAIRRRIGSTSLSVPPTRSTSLRRWSGSTRDVSIGPARSRGARSPHAAQRPPSRGRRRGTRRRPARSARRRDRSPRPERHRAPSASRCGRRCAGARSAARRRVGAPAAREPLFELRVKRQERQVERGCLLGRLAGEELVQLLHGTRLAGDLGRVFRSPSATPASRLGRSELVHADHERALERRVAPRRNGRSCHACSPGFERTYAVQRLSPRSAARGARAQRSSSGRALSMVAVIDARRSRRSSGAAPRDRSPARAPLRPPRDRARRARATGPATRVATRASPRAR